jgi:endonuclease YncB( thermonuclease family)
MYGHSRSSGARIARGEPVVDVRSLLRALALAWLLLAAAGPGPLAAELEGRVVGVRDGDTLDLLTTSDVQVRVRLAGIDAPEMGQAYGNVARRALSSMAYGRIARVEWTKKDDYGRVVGKVRVRDADVALRMIRQGLAWHYRAYAAEQSAADRKRYAAAEDGARAQRTGLWQDPDPVAPWLFRHRHPVRAAGYRPRRRRILPHVKADRARRV